MEWLREIDFNNMTAYMKFSSGEKFLYKCERIEFQRRSKIKVLIFYLFIFILFIGNGFCQDLKFTKIVDLNFPWGSTFISANKLLVTEKKGKIKLVDLRSRELKEIKHKKPITPAIIIIGSVVKYHSKMQEYLDMVPSEIVVPSGDMGFDIWKNTAIVA